MLKFIAATLFIFSGFCQAAEKGTEFHVSKEGTDSNQGTAEKPLLSISKAAELAQAGDTITVHAGTYREWVKPPRGGSSPENRITYRAAEDAKVFIRGSERIDSWKDLGNGVWKAELPEAFFGDYNPYALNVSGDYMIYGDWHHRGDVFLNGKAFYEKKSVAEVIGAADSWHCEVKDGITTIHAHFQDKNPNVELTEINVRESLFMPEITGVNYITVDGFLFSHAASNWSPPSAELQPGAVGPRMGKGWIIENCEVSDVRAVGIILGQAPGAVYEDINSYGDHTVRNNIIRRCGQAGIAGKKGATRSLIEGNLIEETNWRREFGGDETAGLKLHRSVDATIRGNLIRGVYSGREKVAAFGMWIDFANQGMRITRNVIYNTDTQCLFLEMNHGPTLVDNNVFIGEPGISGNSAATIFAHNLFVDAGFGFSVDTERMATPHTPHTSIELPKKFVVPASDKWFSNIFIRSGLADVPEKQGDESDFNVFFEGAKPGLIEGKHSVVNEFSTSFKLTEKPRGVEMEFSVDSALFSVNPPMVKSELFGIFEMNGQALEDRDGKPITVDSDFNGKNFTSPHPGPLSDLQEGKNRLIWTLDSSE